MIFIANKKIIKNLIFIFAIGILILPKCFVLASDTDGGINSTYRYAWSENAGWIDFGTAEGSVHITDTNLTGYAWGENIGWISLNCSNTNSCSTVSYGVANNEEGLLSGYAWSENAGWINFKPENGGVSIDANGDFSGYAWGENIGWIVFNCSTTNSCATVNYKINTDWRPKSSRHQGGAIAITTHNPPTAPSQGFKVSINNDAKYATGLSVELSFTAGSDTAQVSISNFSDFRNAELELYRSKQNWTLLDGDGEKTVYVKFYTRYDQPSSVISDTIILDTKSQDIELLDVKTEYNLGENIILNGKVEPNSEVIFHWNSAYGLIKADDNGKFILNLEKILAGRYELELFANDLAGNKSAILKIEIIIVEPEPKSKIEQEQEENVEQSAEQQSGTIIEKIKETIQPLIPKIIKPKENKAEQPVEEIPLVSEVAPPVFANEWNLLPQKSIDKFVLSPLPKEIKLLTEKFPEFENTLSEIGINKITDIEKLRNIKLSLPTIADMSKNDLPTEIVFAKSGKELINFNMALIVADTGAIKQKIQTVAGKSLQLSVKPEGTVKKIKGYVVFKSKTPKINTIEFSEQSWFASIFFTGPVLAQQQQKPIKIEEEFVLMEFEYIDEDGDGIYTANIQAPIVDGEYEIITVMDYESEEIGTKEIRLIAVIDPEGYIFENIKGKEMRIPDAKVSLFWQNPSNGEYELWPASKYQQDNPQITDNTGKYSFLVPEGNYYLKVEAKGYYDYQNSEFTVKEGSGIHFNFEMKNKNWIIKILDLKLLAVVVLLVLIGVNFYKDKKRDKLLKNK